MHVKTLNSIKVALLGCAAAAFVMADAKSNIVAAQSTGTETMAAGNIETVTVTARRRTERLLDVPIAATALSKTDVERYGSTGLMDLNEQVPTLDFVNTITGTGGGLILRGIASNLGDTGVEQKVTASIDGVTSNSGGILGLGLFDIRDVEVLEGPQSLFYGKSAAAGVVVVNTVSPGDTLDGYVRGSFDTADQTVLGEGAISIPVSDTFAVRIAARASTSRGYVYDSATPMVDPYVIGSPGPDALARAPSDRWGPGLKDVAGRFTAVWQPIDTLDATFKITGDSRNTNGIASIYETVHCPAGATNPVILGIVDLEQDCIGNYRTGSTDAPAGVSMPLEPNGNSYERDVSWLGGLTTNYRMQDVTLTSITGFRSFNEQQANNFTYGLLTDLNGGSLQKNTVWSEELRAQTSFAGPVNFIAGGYYENGQRTFEQVIRVLQFFPDPNTGQWNSAESQDFTSDITYSGFFEGTWKILENLELAAGMRYTNESKTGSIGNVYVNPAPGALNASELPAGQRLYANPGSNNISPEATLTWHPIQDTTLYADYKTGFLAGGITNSGNLTTSLNESDITFTPEKVTGEEIGAKASLLDNRLSFDLDIYEYNYDNLQVISFDEATFAYNIRNAASAVSKGVELQGSYVSDIGIGLHGFLSYNDAYYVSFPNGECYTGQTAATGCIGGVYNQAGHPLASTPLWSGDLGATWDRAIAANWMIGLSGDLYYYGPYNYLATENYQPGYVQKAHVQLNASARLYNPSDSGWELAVIGKNITGAKYVTLAFDAPGGEAGDIDGLMGRPSEYIFQVTYRFAP